MLAAEQGYLSAVTNGDFAKACSYLSSPTATSLQSLAGRGGGSS